MKEIQKKRKSSKREPSIQKWREYYRKAGPVEFAQKELACPVGIPEHPTLGNPKYIILSDQQIEFLDDLFNGRKLSIVSAARGAGKTFSIAVYVCWKISCFDFFESTIMGGSSKQSEIIQNYIAYWRFKNDKIGYIIHKSITGNLNPRVESRWGSIARFTPCSPTASRGPHVQLIVIDEVVSAEQKGIDGAKAVKAVWWQMTGKADSQLIMLSTAQSIFGTFFDYYSGPVGGEFKKYMWGIAKHVSGITDPYKTYKDQNPDNWSPSVWWVTQEDVTSLRKAKSNAEWLCEALGGFSQMGGLIFNREDLDFAICNEKCEECEPYTDKCPAVKRFHLGKDCKRVTERVAGIDWGDRSPNALTILGRKGDNIFVLFNEELMSAMIEEKLRWVKENLDKWKVDIIYPDPEERGMIQALANIGDWAIIRIWEVLGHQAKSELMLNGKRVFEKHLIFIPKKFDSLIRSLKQMSMDERGKIIKRHDHSYDALMYALHEFNEYESLSEFFKVKNREIRDLW